jgi:hypothetical protein
MKNPFKKTPDPSFVMSFFLFAVLMMATFPLLASTSSFVVPNDIALRIRLDDTLTSVDSSVGDPFSATVVDQRGIPKSASVRSYRGDSNVGQGQRAHQHGASL